MSELKLPKPIEAMSDEEGRAFVDTALAHLEKQSDKVKARFAQNIKRAQDRLKHAEGELARIEEARAMLEPHKDDPEGSMHYVNMELLHRVFSATKKMMEIQIGAHQHNLGLMEGFNPMEGEIKFAYPEENLEFQEARARMDVCLGLFHWADAIVGVDAVMRVALNERAIEVLSPEEEERRAAFASELKAAMQADRELAVLVGQLGTELSDTQALLEWGKATLGSLKDLPLEAKRPLLADADWLKLNGKVIALSELGDKVKTYPLLAGVISVVEPGELPYDGVPEAELAGAVQSGTGRLGTGQLGTGQLRK